MPRVARRRIKDHMVRLEMWAGWYRCWEVKPGDYGFSASVEHNGRHYYGEC